MYPRKALTKVLLAATVFSTFLWASPVGAQPNPQHQQKLQNMVCKRFGAYQRRIPSIFPDFTSRATFEALVKASPPRGASPTLNRFIESLRKEAIAMGADTGSDAMDAVAAWIEERTRAECERTDDLAGLPTRDNVTLIVCGRVDAYHEHWTTAATERFVLALRNELERRSSVFAFLASLEGAPVDSDELSLYCREAASRAGDFAQQMIDQRFAQGRRRLCSALEQGVLDDAPVVLSEYHVEDDRYPGQQVGLDAGVYHQFDFGVSTIAVREGFVAQITDIFGFAQSIRGPREVFVGSQSENNLIEVFVRPEDTSDDKRGRQELLEERRKLEEELNEARANLEAATDEEMRAFDSLIELEATLESIASELDAKSEEALSTYTEMRTHLEEVRAADEVRKALALLVNRYPVGHPERRSLESRLEHYETEFDSLMGELSEISARYDALSAEIDALRAEGGRLWLTLSDVRQEAALATVERASTESKMNDIEAALVGIEDALARL